jgi:uncharacterized protein HemY
MFIVIRSTPVTIKDVLSPLILPAIATGIAVAVMIIIKHYLPPLSLYILVALSIFTFIALYLLPWLILPTGKRRIVEISRIPAMMFRSAK